MIKSRWQPVLKFSSPLVQSATLPGPLYYMQLRRPGKEAPIAVQLLLPNQGHTLITDKRQNYFRLQINALHCIESITCLSKKKFSCETLTQLFGKHEAYFNNLLIRFTINLIDDLYEYFTQSWIAALYQEPFSNLLHNINEEGGNTVYEVVKSMYSVSEVCSCRETEDRCHIHRSSEVTVDGIGCTECGQNENLRRKANTFWKTVGGENIVYRHLARYLNNNVVTNPQYVIPEKDLI